MSCSCNVSSIPLVDFHGSCSAVSSFNCALDLPFCRRVCQSLRIRIREPDSCSVDYARSVSPVTVIFAFLTFPHFSKTDKRSSLSPPQEPPATQLALGRPSQTGTTSGGNGAPRAQRLPPLPPLIHTAVLGPTHQEAGTSLRRRRRARRRRGCGTTMRWGGIWTRLSGRGPGTGSQRCGLTSGSGREVGWEGLSCRAVLRRSAAMSLENANFGGALV